MALLSTIAKSLCPIAFPQLQGNSIYPITFSKLVFHVTTVRLLPKLSECKKIPWPNSLKLSKMQVIADKQIKGSFLIKELENKGKEQKRKLQLMWDRECCPDAQHLSALAPITEMHTLSCSMTSLCAWGGGNSSGNIQKGSVRLGMLVCLVSSYSRCFQRMVCRTPMVCEMLETGLQTFMWRESLMSGSCS